MSEYFLADQKAEERARQRSQLREAPRTSAPSQEMKVSLLGDFLHSGHEPSGCDPYNSVQGKPVLDAWQNRRDRR
jgi:hypothetical protein